jgi:hypothetical protein
MFTDSAATGDGATVGLRLQRACHPLKFSKHVNYSFWEVAAAAIA